MLAKWLCQYAIVELKEAEFTEYCSPLMISLILYCQFWTQNSVEISPLHKLHQ